MCTHIFRHRIAIQGIQMRHVADNMLPPVLSQAKRVSLRKTNHKEGVGGWKVAVEVEAPPSLAGKGNSLAAKAVAGRGSCQRYACSTPDPQSG